MASSYPGPVTAMQVGSFFVGQYYQILRQQPDLLHQFYTDTSSIIRVDGESTESANNLMQIHTLAMSLNVNSIEIRTANFLDSWNGGFLLLVSGFIKSKYFSGKRKFIQTFFLAPQEKGYFVLNDMFQYVDEGVAYPQHLPPMSSENIYQQPAAPISSDDPLDNQINASSPHPEPPVSHDHYGLEEEAREYKTAVNIEDDPVDKYSLPDQQHYQEYAEVVVEETPAEEIAVPYQGSVNVMQDAPSTLLDEPVEEPTKKTYASILRVSKGQFSPPAAPQPTVTRTVPTSSDWDHTQPSHAQPDSGLSFTNEILTEVADDGLGDEGEPKSVYVRNLPSDITAEEIEEEFKNFGRIKYDGIFIRNRKDVIGVCYAFVEFEELTSVQNAIKASPVQLAGRQVYIEERRPNSAARGGRGRGRGRGGYQTDAPRGRFSARSLGRGSNQDADYTKARANGLYQRGSR